MQKEINKRVKLYGLAAVLLAVLLVSLCYQLGYIPQLPLSQTSSLMPAFSSYEELREFLKDRSKSQQGYYYYNEFLGGIMVTPKIDVASPLFAQGDSQDIQHSTTNIQVTGVDEADTVKNDGRYIYMITGNKVAILSAYPTEEAQLLSTITFSDITPMEIFVNGDRLAVLGIKSSIPNEPYYPTNPSVPSVDVRYYYGWNYWMDITTYVKLYDISDRAHPGLLTTFTTSGNYISSRMIGDYVYFVASTPAYYAFEVLPNLTIDKVNIPRIELNGYSKEVAPSEISYSNTSDDSFLFTTIAALNIQNTTETPTYKTLMMGGTSTMYVSLNDIYITFPKNDLTTIYRVHIENSTITPEVQGDVPGQVLNQFSMDEYNNYFRIATTTWVNSTQQHNVYVLNMNMSIVGRLEGLALHENFHAARFMGDKCYLVTFQKTDPLFVINLTDPTQPALLGALEIPGYSDYLHPYDENHLIGIGKETAEAVQGNFAWYQGIKIALFDVSNVSNPIQVANYTIGDRGSDSPVLTNHKAFLFDKSKNLLVIPVLVAKIDTSQYPDKGVPSSAYGQPVWQGAYVFNVTEEGFEFRGRITHMENDTSISDSNYYVQRSLYIETVLYTVSNVKVKLNSLEDLTYIKEIRLS